MSEYGLIAEDAGLPIVPGTMDLREGYDEINHTRDMLATHLLNGTHDASVITTGTIDPDRLPTFTAESIVSGTFDAARIPNLPASKITSGTLTVSVSTGGSGRFGDAWNYNIVSTRRSVWMDSSGQLGHTASSERYKAAIRRAELDPLAVLEQLEVVYYVPRMSKEQLIANGGKESTEIGVIAERLAEAGLWEFIFTDDEGQIEGVHYELLALAAIVAAQHVWNEHKSLAERVAQLENGAS